MKRKLQTMSMFIIKIKPERERREREGAIDINWRGDIKSGDLQFKTERQKEDKEREREMVGIERVMDGMRYIEEREIEVSGDK